MTNSLDTLDVDHYLRRGLIGVKELEGYRLIEDTSLVIGDKGSRVEDYVIAYKGVSWR